MPITNRELIRKAGAIDTGTLTSGLLSPEQSRQFIAQTFEATPLGGLVRHEMRKARSGQIDKIGIAGRILRGKSENVDDGYRAKPNFGQVDYNSVSVRLPWEITEETLRENIEGQGLEATITNLMTRQVGVDREDLSINGDTTTPASDPDCEFLKLNDGWVKQVRNGGHVTDHAGAEMDINVFYKALKSMPNKYNSGKLRWLMSPHRQQEYERYLLDKAITVGGIISDKRIENPCSIPAIPVPSFPDDAIMLTDPQNLIVVNTYGMVIRKTTEGKEAIMQDKRFYVIHFDFDNIIEELDATSIITGLKKI
ncbi:MAG: hypothetical protein RR365_14105 [Bacteroides sp.]